MNLILPNCLYILSVCVVLFFRVMALNSHKSEKKKKKLYKDSLSVAAMLRKFQKEKEAFKKKEANLNPTVSVTTSTPNKVSAAPATGGSDVSDLNLIITDPVLSIFSSTSERELLQEAEIAVEMLGDIDLDRLLDGTSNGSPVSEPSGENGNVTQPSHTSEVLTLKQVPALPEGLPAHLEKRIEDLRTVSVAFLVLNFAESCYSPNCLTLRLAIFVVLRVTLETLV